MREALTAMWLWEREQKRYVAAAAIRTWGSAPRPVGSMMAVNEHGLMAGSVSGGCVESEVIDRALGMMDIDAPQLLHFDHIPQQTLMKAGLTCGGELDILVWRPGGEEWKDFLKAPVPRAFKLSVETGEGVNVNFADTVRAELSDGHLLIAQPPQDRLMIFGASHISVPLVRFAKEVDFQVVLVDPRTAYMQPERYPVMPDFFVPLWPDQAYESFPPTEQTYVAALSHDEKIDVPAIRGALRSNVAYIGALGSPTTQDLRREALSIEGFSAYELDRIHGPIGLDIGARSPEEIALSIVAEAVKVRRLASYAKA